MKATRRRVLVPTEHAVQAALIEWAGYHAGRYPELAYLFAVPNGDYRDPVVAKRLREEGTVAGAPDLLWLLPRGGYHGLALELKVGDNEVSPEQQAFHQFLRREGYYVAVVYDDWEIGADLLVRYLAGAVVRASAA